MPNSTKVDTLDRYYEDERKRVDKQYKADIAALDRNKNVQMQEAAINNELLKKYLPQMNQMSGLSGLGVSESANIDALSRYQNTVTDINRGYRESVDSLDRYRNADLASINAAERMEQREDRRDAYGVALEHIASGAITDEDTLDRYLDAVTPSVSDLQLQQLKALGKSLVGEKADSMGSTTASGAVDQSGGTVKIPIPTQDGGGLKLDLSILGETDFQKAIDAGAKRENGEVFVYDKAIYFKNNDRVYELADPEGNNNSEVYSAIYAYLNDDEEMINAADPIKKFFDEAKAERDKSKAENPIVDQSGVQYQNYTLAEVKAIPPKAPGYHTRWAPILDASKDISDDVIFNVGEDQYIKRNKKIYRVKTKGR